MPVQVALERGYFADAGLELEVSPFRTGSDLAAALGRGEVDLGVGGHLQTLAAGDQVFIGPLGFERAPDHLPIAVVAATDDLAGAAIGVSSRAAISELQLRIFLGADFETVTLTPLPFSEMADVLRRGDVAAVSAPDPLVAELVNERLGRVIDRGSLSRALAAGRRVLIAGLVTTRGGGPSSGPVLNAIGRAVDELRAEPTPAGQHQPYFDHTLEPEDLQVVFDLAFEHGLIERRAKADDVIN